MNISLYVTEEKHVHTRLPPAMPASQKTSQAALFLIIIIMVKL